MLIDQRWPVYRDRKRSGLSCSRSISVRTATLRTVSQRLAVFDIAAIQ